MGAPDVRTRDREDPVPRVHGRSRRAGFASDFGKRHNSLPNPYVQVGKIAGRISGDRSVELKFDNDLVVVFVDAEKGQSGFDNLDLLQPRCDGPGLGGVNRTEGYPSGNGMGLNPPVKTREIPDLRSADAVI
jgi:hypothetical protein